MKNTHLKKYGSFFYIRWIWYIFILFVKIRFCYKICFTLKHVLGSVVWRLTWIWHGRHMMTWNLTKYLTGPQKPRSPNNLPLFRLEVVRSAAQRPESDEQTISLCEIIRSRSQDQIVISDNSVRHCQDNVAVGETAALTWANSHTSEPKSYNHWSSWL